MMRRLLNLIISLVWLPLDILLIPIALVMILLKACLKRYRDVEGSLRTWIPVKMHQLKLKIQELKEKRKKS